jgi:hypothetical protein
MTNTNNPASREREALEKIVEYIRLHPPAKKGEPNPFFYIHDVALRALAGSMEGRELTKEEQVYSLDDALIWEDDRVNLSLQETIEQLNAAGYRITRTAPGGAKPGEV